MLINLEIAKGLLELNCTTNSTFVIVKVYSDFTKKTKHRNILCVNAESKKYSDRGYQIFMPHEVVELEKGEYTIAELERKIIEMDNRGW